MVLWHTTSAAAAAGAAAGMEAAPTGIVTSPDADALRKRYLGALVHLDAGDTAAFEQAKAGLVGYALYPYLDLRDHLQRLPQLKAADVSAFRKRWSAVPVADLLYNAWMDNLAEQDSVGYVRP